MKTFIGTVISSKMDKTISVEVSRRWSHPLYQKTVKRTKKYLVHDDQNQAHPGDQVRFRESRPFSKKKRFLLLEVVAHHTLIKKDLLSEAVIKSETT
jgi:small subunit ribosomal protein S17